MCKNCNNCGTEMWHSPSIIKRIHSCSTKCRHEYKQLTKILRKNKCLNCRQLTNNKKYCNNKCQAALQTSNLDKECEAHYLIGKISNRNRLKKLLLQQYGHCCSICSTTNWRDKPVTLWVDHIDGNAGNNLPSNLRLVCPNCDTQGTTWGNRNTGLGRRSRGLKPWQ